MEVYGDYLLETDLTLDAKITWLAQLEHFEMSYELRNTIDIGMRASSELQVSSSVKLAEVTFSPVTFTIPPVPVVITPKLVVNLGINGEITGEIVTNVTYQNSLKVGSRFQRDSGWREIMERDDDFSFNPPTIGLEAEMEAYLNPEFEMALYGVLSGYMTASFYSEIEAGIDRDPWWELFLGLQAGVGVRAAVLDKELFDYSKPDLLDLRWSVAEASDVKPLVTTISVENVTKNGATVVGEVERSKDASPITGRGVCWSENENPTLDDECEEKGEGSGDFSVDIINLRDNTEYSVTAYGTNNAGTEYGNQRNFTTESESDNNDWPRDTETKVVDVTNPETGRTWMDRNLGASRAATSSTDEQAYGDLYQWGRAADGHQKRNSSTIGRLSSNDQPGHDDFILNSESPYDWRSPQNNNLWQRGGNGVNNPCPRGYRLPTAAEIIAERESWSSRNAAGAFTSPLKLPLAGGRSGRNGSLFDVGSEGHYWYSTELGPMEGPRHLYFTKSFAITGGNRRVNGSSVRCIKD